MESLGRPPGKELPAPPPPPVHRRPCPGGWREQPGTGNSRTPVPSRVPCCGAPSPPHFGSLGLLIKAGALSGRNTPVCRIVPPAAPTGHLFEDLGGACPGDWGEEGRSSLQQPLPHDFSGITRGTPRAAPIGCTREEGRASTEVKQ
uniref:Uncharacterized protein n=2 Tax=Pan TaxID=9596 RepID=A0A2I3TAB4_PANTR